MVKPALGSCPFGDDGQSRYRAAAGSRLPLSARGMPRDIGIDDGAEWARVHVEGSSAGWHTEGFRKGRTSGVSWSTWSRRPLDLLPDRSCATVAAWLRRQPQIAVIAHDRSTETGGRPPVMRRWPYRSRPVASYPQHAPGAGALALPYPLKPATFAYPCCGRCGNDHRPARRASRGQTPLGSTKGSIAGSSTLQLQLHRSRPNARLMASSHLVLLKQELFDLRPLATRLRDAQKFPYLIVISVHLVLTMG